MKKTETSTATRIWVSIFILISLLLIAMVVALVMGTDDDTVGANVAVIKIAGPITGDNDESLFAAYGTSSTDVVEQLERARDDASIKAVLLEINSPGGSAVASDEIGQAVKEVRAANKTVVAWVRESGASGAYWIASSSDHIVANRMSVTGSIGVISSYMEFDEFLDDWNVSYNRLIAGERKDIGDPFVNLTGERRAFLQHKLNRVHGFFIEEVARNRNMTEAQVRQIATGEFYLGIEAYELGLVDELGGKNEAIAYIEGRIGDEASLVEFEPEHGFFEEFFGIFGGAKQQTTLPVRRNQMLEESVPVPMLR
jgi:protease IV